MKKWKSCWWFLPIPCLISGVGSGLVSSASLPKSQNNHQLSFLNQSPKNYQNDQFLTGDYTIDSDENYVQNINENTNINKIASSPYGTIIATGDNHLRLISNQSAKVLFDYNVKSNITNITYLTNANAVVIITIDYLSANTYKYGAITLRLNDYHEQLVNDEFVTKVYVQDPIDLEMSIPISSNSVIDQVITMQINENELIVMPAGWWHWKDRNKYMLKYNYYDNVWTQESNLFSYFKDGAKKAKNAILAAEGFINYKNELCMVLVTQYEDNAKACIEYYVNGYRKAFFELEIKGYSSKYDHQWFEQTKHFHLEKISDGTNTYYHAAILMNYLNNQPFLVNFMINENTNHWWIDSINNFSNRLIINNPYYQNGIFYGHTTYAPEFFGDVPNQNYVYGMNVLKAFSIENGSLVNQMHDPLNYGFVNSQNISLNNTRFFISEISNIAQNNDIIIVPSFNDNPNNIIGKILLYNNETRYVSYLAPSLGPNAFAYTYHFNQNEIRSTESVSTNDALNNIEKYINKQDILNILGSGVINNKTKITEVKIASNQDELNLGNIKINVYVQNIFDQGYIQSKWLQDIITVKGFKNEDIQNTTLKPLVINYSDQLFKNIFNHDKGFWVDWINNVNLIDTYQKQLLEYMNANLSFFFNHDDIENANDIFLNTSVKKVEFDFNENNNIDKNMLLTVNVTYSGFSENQYNDNIISSNIKINLRPYYHESIQIPNEFNPFSQYHNYLQSKIEENNGLFFNELGLKQTIINYLNLDEVKRNIPNIFLENDTLLIDKLIIQENEFSVNQDNQVTISNQALAIRVNHYELLLPSITLNAITNSKQIINEIDSWTSLNDYSANEIKDLFNSQPNHELFDMIIQYINNQYLDNIFKYLPSDSSIIKINNISLNNETSIKLQLVLSSYYKDCELISEYAFNLNINNIIKQEQQPVVHPNTILICNEINWNDSWYQLTPNENGDVLFSDDRGFGADWKYSSISAKAQRLKAFINSWKNHFFNSNSNDVKVNDVQITITNDTEAAATIIYSGFLNNQLVHNLSANIKFNLRATPNENDPIFAQLNAFIQENINNNQIKKYDEIWFKQSIIDYLNQPNIINNLPIYATNDSYYFITSDIAINNNLIINNNKTMTFDTGCLTTTNKIKLQLPKITLTFIDDQDQNPSIDVTQKIDKIYYHQNIFNKIFNDKGYWIDWQYANLNELSSTLLSYMNKNINTFFNDALLSTIVSNMKLNYYDTPTMTVQATFDYTYNVNLDKKQGTILIYLKANNIDDINNNFIDHLNHWIETNIKIPNKDELINIILNYYNNNGSYIPNQLLPHNTTFTIENINIDDQILSIQENNLSIGTNAIKLQGRNGVIVIPPYHKQINQNNEIIVESNKDDNWIIILISIIAAVVATVFIILLIIYIKKRNKNNNSQIIWD